MVSKTAKEKKKDFQLRVGKSKPKGNTHTDTSFVTKAISLPSQSITKKLDTNGSFTHYLALAKHHSPFTRKAAILYLQEHSFEHVSNLRPVFASVAPLILDQSRIVRDSVLELFKSPMIMENLEYHVDFIILYIHSAMTHISPEIRSQSTQFLDVLLEAAPKTVCRIAWAKTLSCFFPLLGWPIESKDKSSKGAVAASTMTTGLSFGSNAPKARLGHLQSLDKFITVGIDSCLDEQTSDIAFHPETSRFLMSSGTNPFVSLNIFGNSLASDPSITEDSRSRLDLVKSYWSSLARGLEDAIKEAGQLGRVAKSLLVVLEKTL